MTMPNLEAKFKRERAYGKERFRGLVRWDNEHGGTTKVLCEETWTNKEFALDHARHLLAALRKRDWVSA